MAIPKWRIALDSLFATHRPIDIDLNNPSTDPKKLYYNFYDWYLKLCSECGFNPIEEIKMNILNLMYSFYYSKEEIYTMESDPELREVLRLATAWSYLGYISFNSKPSKNNMNIIHDTIIFNNHCGHKIKRDRI